MKTKLRHPIFLALHATGIMGVLLLPIYMKVSAWISGVLGGCVLHRFFIYCPLCGGTRAVAALVRFDFLAAWNYNAFVVILAFLALGIDIWMWVRYFQKKEPLIIVPRWSWVSFCVLLVAYFLLRNVLMIFFGIDPTGDLGFFWDAVRAIKG